MQSKEPFGELIVLLLLLLFVLLLLMLLLVQRNVALPHKQLSKRKPWALKGASRGNRGQGLARPPDATLARQNGPNGLDGSR